jgi:hypothetical protein
VRPGVDPQLIAQPVGQVLVGGERVGLPAVGEQGQHESGDQVLVQRVRPGEAFEVGNVVVDPERGVGVDQVELGGEALLVQPVDQPAGAAQAREVRQGRSAPQGEPFLEQGPGLPRVPRGEPGVAEVRELPEPQGVDGVRGDVENVAPAEAAQR